MGRERAHSTGVGRLIGLLNPAAAAIADAGGLARTMRHPLEGDDQIVRYFVGIAGKLPGLTIGSARSTVNPVW